MNFIPTGTRIAHFEILGELGRGGMGVVYEARDHVLHRTVALKILAESLSSNAEFVERFQQEARTAAQLNHPNIVTIYSVGEDKGLYYLAMEMVSGRTLAEVIQTEAPLEVPRALSIAFQIASALTHAHSHGVLHRDIKPRNIMVHKLVKILDFGIAQMAKRNPDHDPRRHPEYVFEEDVVGTPAYMSPERFTGAVANQSADFYALGVVLYEMLTRTKPFIGQNAPDIIHRILSEEPLPIRRINAAVSREVAAVVSRLMAKSPGERYQSGAEIQQAIVRVHPSFNAHADLKLDGPTVHMSQDELNAIHDSLNAQPARKKTFFLRTASLFTALASSKTRPPIFRFAAAALILLPVLVIAAVSIKWTASSAEPAPARPTAAAIPVTPVQYDPIPATYTNQSYPYPANGIALVNMKPAATDPVASDLDWSPGDGISQDSATTASAGQLIIKKTGEPAKGEPTNAPSPAEVRANIKRAIAFYDGTSGGVNEAEARRLMVEAAKTGDPTAEMWCAWFYHWGRCGFKKDREHAAQFARKSLPGIGRLAESGDANAQFLLAAAIDAGYASKAGDPLHWINASADSGNTNAMSYCGYLHFAGRAGLAEDHNEAARWFQKAARAGNVGAMYNLGWLCVNGTGVQRDDSEAMRWFMKGAVLGSAVCMNSVGWMHENGRGTPEDKAEALTWYKKAAILGDATAKENLQKLGAN